MTKEEIEKLKKIVHDAWWNINTKSHRPTDVYLERLESWNRTCDELGIERLGKLTHLVLGKREDLVSVEDPTESTLRMTEETARKILVLGMP
mgnify:CR=1 FL=1